MPQNQPELPQDTPVNPEIRPFDNTLKNFPDEIFSTSPKIRPFDNTSAPPHMDSPKPHVLRVPGTDRHPDASTIASTKYITRMKTSYNHTQYIFIQISTSYYSTTALQTAQSASRNPTAPTPYHTRPYLIRNRLATTTLSHRTTPNFTPDIDTVGSSIRGKRAVAGQNGGAGISQKMAEVGWWGAVVKHK